MTIIADSPISRTKPRSNINYDRDKEVALIYVKHGGSSPLTDLRLIPFEVQSDVEKNARDVLTRVGANVIPRTFDNAALQSIGAAAAGNALKLVDLLNKAGAAGKGASAADIGNVGYASATGGDVAAASAAEGAATSAAGGSAMSY